MRLQELLEADSDYNPLPIEDEEGATDPIRSIVEQTVGYMEDNCQPWLKAAGLSNTVYRGTRYEQYVFTRKVRQDRVPHDTSEEMHDLFDKLIQLAGGIANRSNSVFVSGDSSQASEYGYERVAIPVGHFQYTWSPLWKDWYSSLIEDGQDMNLTKLMYPEIGKQVREIYRDGHDTDSAWEIIMNTKAYDPVKLDKAIIANKGLLKAIHSNHEIMIRCDTVLYIEPGLYFNHIAPLYTEQSLKRKR